MEDFQVVALLIYIIGAFGAFGSINVLIAVIRLKPRLKSSLLVALLAFADIFCIVSEFQNATRNILKVKSYRTECFWAISPYLVMTEVQSRLMCALAFDRLVAFTFPIEYVTMSTRVICQRRVDLCGHCQRCLYIKFLVLKSRRAHFSEFEVLNKQKKLSTSCCVMITVFLMSSFVSNMVMFLSKKLNISETLADKLDTYMVVPAMISYSQSYYVYFACSRLYRETFKKQLQFILPGWLGRVLNDPRVTIVSVTPSRY
ncbi:hypothetical protein QR680_015675 [Steinernema hermaphroditum]|uniref:G-protein coupled receptors family 1 profile domain-containing protein n=1 Tax=Steinernema hermaphroditum TaxID=289476 RepID=A0AA39H8W7_9BILA|nr:hypothetical protein QR680_015675 [Steinernema hermaphroditum]